MRDGRRGQGWVAILINRRPSLSQMSSLATRNIEHAELIKDRYPSVCSVAKRPGYNIERDDHAKHRITLPAAVYAPLHRRAAAGHDLRDHWRGRQRVQPNLAGLGDRRAE